MKKVVLLSLIFSSLGFLFIACGESEGSDVKAEKEEGTIVYVKTMQVKSEEFVEYISLLGVAKADMHALLSSTEGGRIEKIYKDKGSFVKKGDVIAETDNDVLLANLEANKAMYEKAEVNFLRQEKIFNEKVSSEIQFLNSKYERDVAKANYELSKARYEQSFIKAPFSGIVDQKFAEVGEIVLAASPIVSLVSMNQIKIEVGVPENYIGLIKKGGNARVSFRDIGDLVYDAKITYVGNTISTSNRTFPIEIMLHNQDNKIKPELSANVFIEKLSYDSAIKIPQEVISKTDLGYVVFVENNNTAYMREIDIISRFDNYAAISSGLEDGDNLIVVGYQNLVDGEKVKVVE